MSPLYPLGKGTRKEKNQENVFNTEQEGGIQEEGKGKQGEGDKIQEDTSTQAEKMIDGRVGRQEEEGHGKDGGEHRV